MKLLRYYTNDPVADYERYSAEQEKILQEMPVCSECGEHIQDEYCFSINDEIICESCMENYRKFTLDLVEA